MEHIPYKHYLQLLKDTPKSTLKNKLLLASFTFILGVVGIYSALYYQYKKTLPQVLKYQYIQTTASDFSAVNQSTAEILSAFKVAGQKVVLVDKLQDAPDQADGFFVALDDLEKTSSLLQSTQSTIEDKKSALLQRVPPGEFEDFAARIADFYNQSEDTIGILYKDQLFAKQLLLASGPKFYLPTLTDDKLWDKPDKKTIIDYYKSAKTEASVALENLSKLSPPEHFQPYYQAQVDYLSRLAKLSDNIINTLSVSDDPNKDVATQIEKAYQLLVGAKRENELTQKKLLDEKLKLVDIGQNLQKLSPIELQKNTLQDDFQQAFESTPKVEPANVYFEPLFKKVNEIASGIRLSI